LPLTPKRLEQLQALFELALERPAAERAALLAAQAPDDPAIQAEVLALIRAHERDEGALRSPVSASALADAALGADRRIGSRVGAYQVVRLVGVGGMGAVYEAARADDQFHKRVAIKFLERPAAGPEAIRRFRAERQILATLSHPGIAALLDGGVTEDGQPYFVMEYIDGAPITEWCDQRQLPIRDRLALFQQVAAAVGSAHQSLVVHRDLKPGNIFVAADGQVKLLDFGIAKLLRPDDDGEQFPATRPEHRSFTPEYAAPEQVRGLAVGTAADVYALGVVLFELLAGRRPFDLQGKLLAEVERIVCEQTPPRPSSLVDAERAALLCERSAGRARARLEGDLDAIVAVALRKEPERRYGSVDLLARDIEQHLAGHPVSARPDTLGYRVRKLVRRRKLETGAFAFAAISVATGFAGVTIQANQAEEQRRRAEQVTGVLSTMLGAADPATLGRDVTVREVLDSAAARADTLRDLPALEAEVRTIIGNTYMSLGEFAAAEAQFRRAAAAQRSRAPSGDHATALALTRQSHALEYLGEYAAADSVLNLAAEILGRFPYRKPLDRAAFLDQRGRILSRLGRNAEAEPVFQEALNLTWRYAGSSDSLLAYAYVNLGYVKSELGELAASESLYVAAVAAARRAFGDEHPGLAAILSPYATVLERAGKSAEADSTYRAVLAMRRKLLGPEHPEYAWTMFNYADLMLSQRRYPEAAHWAREVLALRGRTLPDSHPAVSTAMGVLGRALGAMASLAAGERWLRESLALRRRTLPEGHWMIASSESILGEHLARAGRYAQAESLLVASAGKLAEIRGENATVVQDARARLVSLYEAWGRPADAAQWRARIAVVTPPAP
jgi:serine/threonine-protein kinase